LAIDLGTGHLQIMSPDSPYARNSAFGDVSGDLALIDYGQELEAWLRSRSGFVAATLSIETTAAIFSLGGEELGALQIKGFDAKGFSEALPEARFLDGIAGFAWSPGDAEALILAPREAYRERKDETVFTRGNFRPKDEAWTAFKGLVASELPALFAQEEGPSASDPSDEGFLAALNRALERTDLPSILPDREGSFDYRVEDASADLEDAQATSGGRAASPPRQLRILRKRLFQALYPAQITPVMQEFAKGMPVTLAMPPARVDEPLPRPVIVPARHGGFYRNMPLYGYFMVMDAAPMRAALGLDERSGTSLLVRLDSVDRVASFKVELEGWIASRGLRLIVRDYLDLGKLYAATTLAFRVMLLVLVALMAATATIFVGNSVYLSLLKRRREIGTALALGLGPGGNAAIMLGEVAVLALCAWAAGALLCAGLVLAFRQWGLPGLPFFPEGKLRFVFGAGPFLYSLAIVLAASLASASLPLSSLRRARPVDLLKEAS
ncbi:MAG: hypothetical protein Q8M76_06095, partial [Spirochaetaceae bacterium]|nr:hypothetical protein [Spirochaetaceae bacterium]